MSAANTVPLPEPKPRAVGEHCVVPPIRSREVARAERSRVRHSEDALQSLDLGNGLFGVHASTSIANQLQVVRGVPLSMSRMPPECLDVEPPDRSIAADVLLREEPEEEEDDEEEDDGKEDGADDEDDDGYSE